MKFPYSVKVPPVTDNVWIGKYFVKGMYHPHREWCRINIGPLGEQWDFKLWNFYFASERDMVMFLLRWA